MKIVVKLLAECNTKKSDHENGYYIVSECWNTCFHRWANNMKDRIEVRRNDDPSCAHTYTRIPTTSKHNIFFIYINCLDVEGFVLNLKERQIIVGSYEPQRSADYLNFSFLVYSPDGVAPDIEEYHTQGAFIKHPNLAPVNFRIDMLCPLSIFVRSFKIAE